MTTAYDNIKHIAPSAFGKVAVAMGGHSAERLVSLDSGAAVLEALLEKGVDAYKFDPKAQDLTELVQYDRVFNVMHGRGGEDGQLQGFLDMLGVPYTGSGVLGSAIGMDKVRTKQLWSGAGIPTAPFMMLRADTDWQQVVDTIGLPLIVKPVHEGSSIGMSKVSTVDGLPQAYAKAAETDPVVMAEKWIEGSEYTIVIIAGAAYPVIRLQPALDAAFYDYEAKYERNDTTYGIPSGLTSVEEMHLQDICLQAFASVGASGWGRIDAMRDADGRFWLLEVNTVPGMTSHSLVPMAAKAKGIDFTQLCYVLLSQTLV